MAEMLKGDAVAPFDIERKLRAKYTLLGVHNIVLFAMSGIDMAAWDAPDRRSASRSRACWAPRRGRSRLQLQGSGHHALKPLVKEAVELLAEGFTAVKLRLGRPDAHEDLQAIREVKKAIGPNVVLMVDFNQGLSVAEALNRGRMIDEEGGICWDRGAGARRRLRRQRPPGARDRDADPDRRETSWGRSRWRRRLRRRLRFRHAGCAAHRRVTGWMRAAALAQGAGMEMSSHLFPEASCHLLAATPTCHWLEFVDWAAPVLQDPVQVKDGHVLIPERPGLGMTWDEKAVKRFAV